MPVCVKVSLEMKNKKSFPLESTRQGVLFSLYSHTTTINTKISDTRCVGVYPPHTPSYPASLQQWPPGGLTLSTWNSVWSHRLRSQSLGLPPPTYFSCQQQAPGCFCLHFWPSRCKSRFPQLSLWLLCLSSSQPRETLIMFTSLEYYKRYKWRDAQGEVWGKGLGAFMPSPGFSPFCTLCIVSYQPLSNPSALGFYTAKAWWLVHWEGTLGKACPFRFSLVSLGSIPSSRIYGRAPVVSLGQLQGRNFGERLQFL
jgi:hypothetical protein